MGSPEQRVVHSSVDPNWQTPQPLYDKLNAEANFSVDLAADGSTCKVIDLHSGDHFYFGPGHPKPEYRNSLTVNWAEVVPRGVGFLNMPYSKAKIRELQALHARRKENGATPQALEALRQEMRTYDVAEWIRKAYNESLEGFTTYALVPFSPQTDWYRKYVMGHGDQGQWRGHCATEVRRFPYRVGFDPSPEYAAHMLNELAQGRRKSGKVSSAGHNVVVAIFKPNPGYVGPWQPVERYYSYR